MKRPVSRVTKAKSRKALGSSPAKPSKRTGRQQPAPHGDLVIAGARALGIRLDPAWNASVAFNLRLILAQAALVDQFALPDDTEPAAVFHA